MCFCDKIVNEWNIDKLINDLSNVKQECRLTNDGVTEKEKNILCAILYFANQQGRFSLNQIAEKIASPEQPITGNAIRNMLSTTIYEYFEYLTDRRPASWIDFVRILEGSKYRISDKPKHENPVIKEMAIIVAGKKLTNAEKEAIQKYAREVTGDNTLRILRTETGSIKLIFEGSQVGYEKILELFESGQLDKIAGFSVLDVEVTLQRQKNPVNLTQWFTGIFTETWQNVEQLLTPRQLGIAHFSEQIKRAKRIDLRIDLITHSVVLVVNIDRENINQIVVTLQLYPTDGNKTLPEGLKLIVLAAGEVFQEIIARSADQLMQCRFDAELGDEFTLELRLGEAIIKENFEL